MSLLPILIIPDPVLRQKAAPVNAITAETLRLLENMLETMYHAPGIGLAAPQIGVLQRLAVVDLGERGGAEDGIISDPLKLINPEIIWRSEDANIYEEGCLSIPGISAEITRPKKVRVRYTDTKGKTQELDADGLLATCIQHEIDHLDGVLFIDYLSKLKRDSIVRKMTKLKRELSAAAHNPKHDL